MHFYSLLLKSNKLPLELFEGQKIGTRMFKTFQNFLKSPVPHPSPQVPPKPQLFHILLLGTSFSAGLLTNPLFSFHFFTQCLMYIHEGLNCNGNFKEVL